MTTVVCDEGKLKILLEEAEKCPKLKNIVKIGDKVTDEEKAAGDKLGIKIISFKDLEVNSRQLLFCLSEKILPCPLFTCNEPLLNSF